MEKWWGWHQKLFYFRIFLTEPVNNNNIEIWNLENEKVDVWCHIFVIADPISIWKFEKLTMFWLFIFFLIFNEKLKNFCMQG